MPRATPRRYLLPLFFLNLLVGFTHSLVGAPRITAICSTASQPWESLSSAKIQASQTEPAPQLRIATSKTSQTIDGFGGCFNELGWLALNHLTDAERNGVLQSLFGEDGCAFTLARLPIGASDFAVDGYSLDDTPGDLALEHFSLARDREHLLPFVKAAQRVRPELQCWGSAWSPPAWMKQNNHYSKGSLRWEPAVLRCYANYLARWAEAYRYEGVRIYALHTQNEPNIASPYPSCLWTGDQLREFIADYLGPIVRERKLDLELWLGTINGDTPNNGSNINDRLISVMEDPKAAQFLTGVAIQYDRHNLIGKARALYPRMKLMQSETECGKGENSWADAQRLFDLMRHYFDGGASSYFAWNMVLDETGMSTWNWRQNALVTVDRTTRQVRYNGEFQVLRHFSHFVKPGAHRVLTSGLWDDALAFVNPDGSTVLIVSNKKDAQSLDISFTDGSSSTRIAVSLPAASITTLVLAP